MLLRVIIFIYPIVLLVLTSCNPETLQENRIKFDYDWKFSSGDHPGASTPDFDDNNWRTIDLPHDFTIEHQYDSLNNTTHPHRNIGWYRKHFSLDENGKNGKINILFNGVYRNSEVWINGNYLGSHPNGYTSFYYDLTPYLKKPGKDNIIAIKINAPPQSKLTCYHGSGIYRHVWLTVTGKVHFDQWGVLGQTISADSSKAIVQISVKILNEYNRNQSCEVSTDMLNADGRVVGKSNATLIFNAGDSIMVTRKIRISNPQLWSIKNPYLYKLRSVIKINNEIQDEYITNFGIRTFRFDPNLGFLLNGEHVKLYGVNHHADGGSLGSAGEDYTFQRQLKILKSMGCNALRTGHHPPAPELLDYADSLGFVVIDEIFDEWLTAKRKNGYAPYFRKWYKNDISNWIRRDRNHPSIIAWNIGDDVIEQKQANGPTILRLLIKTLNEFDTSRPITATCSEIIDANETGFTKMLDIVGYNYSEALYSYDHKKYPERVIYGAETCVLPNGDGDMCSLHQYEDWLTGYLENFVAGEFLLTGFDYLNELDIEQSERVYNEPKCSDKNDASSCGLIDICGFKKPGYWLRKALWTNEPVMYIAVKLPDTISDRKNWTEVQSQWNHTVNGDTLSVEVYTNMPDVELLLNGRSLGKQHWDITKEICLQWKVPYQPGTLEAIGSLADGTTNSYKIKTAGEPKRIKLITEKRTLKADKQDISYVKVIIVDEDNIQIPFESKDIEFEVTGAGRLISVGNGDPYSKIALSSNTIKTYQGQCLAIVQSGNTKGEITLKAFSSGLKSDEVQLKVE